MSEKIKRTIGIIPYSPAHDNIIENAYGELNSRYHECAYNAAFYQVYGRAAADNIDQSEDKSASQTHSPMGVTACCDLHKGVQEVTH